MSEKTDLQCFLCAETFQDPVTLSCYHIFCSECLRRFCEENQTKNCPICSEDDSQKTESSEGGCDKHPDTKATMFCINEQRVMCMKCEFQTHDRSHTVVSVKRVVKKLKKSMNTDLLALQYKRKIFEEAEQTYKLMMEHSEQQVETTEKQIMEEFNRMEQFLIEEKEFRFKILMEERYGKKMAIMSEMQLIKDQMSALSESISKVEQELQKPDLLFICSFKEAQDDAKVQCSTPNPTFEPGLLIDMAKHVGNLTFRIWERMKDIVQITPVILDPNTAYPYLRLSKDLSSVRCSDTPQNLPNNPERSSNTPTVLGSKAFSSKTHTWDVQVGDHPNWTIGVVNTTIDKKGRISATPNHGKWCLSLRDGKYNNGDGKIIRLQTNPEKIRVTLDFDKGQLSFHDCKDMTHIYSHKYKFKQKLLPYFTVGAALYAKSPGIRVCSKGSRQALESIYCYETATAVRRPAETPENLEDAAVYECPEALYECADLEEVLGSSSSL